MAENGRANGSASASGGTITAARVEHYATFQFRVEIEGKTVATFSECGGLEVSVKYDEVREGGQNEFVHRLPGRVEYGNLVLKRGYVPADGTASGEGLSEFFRWCLTGLNRQGSQVQRHDVTVTLMALGTAAPIYSWVFRRCYPVKWSGPALKAGDNAVAVESLELAHEGLLIRSI
jgi:phage tail-like protein